MEESYISHIPKPNQHVDTSVSSSSRTKPSLNGGKRKNGEWDLRTIEGKAGAARDAAAAAAAGGKQ